MWRGLGFTPRGRTVGRGKDHAQVLLAQHLADRIELMVSRGLERDLDQSAADERERVLAAASEYPRPRGSSTRAQSLFNAMNTAVTAHLPDFPRTTQDTGDIWQLAEAAAAGAQVFATWDERLLSTVAPLALKADHAPELARMRVLDPNHLEVRLDELAHAAPTALTTCREASSLRCGQGRIRELS